MCICIVETKILTTHLFLTKRHFATYVAFSSSIKNFDNVT